MGTHTEEKKVPICLGVLAHVDAGKTTLSEALLYVTGKTRKLGRVDNRDAYLDTYQLERERGITIFSKQALFEVGSRAFTLLDTPGHVDFSAEMERTLQVLDYAVLVLSGTEGVQGHTHTLWQLLKRYGIPTFIFVNKMDRPDASQEKLLAEVKAQLSEQCVSLMPEAAEAVTEELAMVNEAMMNQYLTEGKVSLELIAAAIKGRELFPVFFGSALKLEGIQTFLAALGQLTLPSARHADFGAKVFKITRDEEGNRLTHLKVTGGALSVKQVIEGAGWSEKVNQIRVYSGEKYQVRSECLPGEICAVTGLSLTQAGTSLGTGETGLMPFLEPVLAYRLNLPKGVDPTQILPKLRQLEEEDPQLKIVWHPNLSEIHVHVMGEIQIEILREMLKQRFDLAATLDEGSVIYKETLQNEVEGVGHFEPLRHYAEVHILLTPLAAGSGIQVACGCSEDVLDKNWQRLIQTHIEEKSHVGVLIGAPLTDVKMTILGGRAHKKHTEGGDFREATYRAIRQGLMEAQSVVLEPYYQFKIELPESMVGRAMTDVERLGGKCELTAHQDGVAVLSGEGPVVQFRNYPKDLAAYTKGMGKFLGTLSGYKPCHNQEKVVAEVGYDPELDKDNPTGSIFCAHGAGYFVPWDEVKAHRHVESNWKKSNKPQSEEEVSVPKAYLVDDRSIGLEEIDAILHQATGSNKGEKSNWKKHKAHTTRWQDGVQVAKSPTSALKKEHYLLVDGYNVIFAFEPLRELAQVTFDGARDRLLELLCNYQAIKNQTILVVFDAYKVPGNLATVTPYHNIYQVFTKESQTADAYIEHFVHHHAKDYTVTVATSDGLEQIIIRGQGCGLLSARELMEDVARTNAELLATYQAQQPQKKNYLHDRLDEATKQKLIRP